jgi:hypothetical protein
LLLGLLTLSASLAVGLRDSALFIMVLGLLRFQLLKISKLWKLIQTLIADQPSKIPGGYRIVNVT